jgi:hypothetical protein
MGALSEERNALTCAVTDVAFVQEAAGILFRKILNLVFWIRPLTANSCVENEVVVSN